MRSESNLQWRSFADYETYVRGLAPEKARGDAFEDLVAAYLRLTPELALVDVWELVHAPDDVLKRLGLSNHDIGIDFVARRRDGALWAIQAKFRSDQAPVTWRELSTFVGAAARADYRLLVSNSIDLPRNRPIHLDEERFGAVLAADLQALEAEFFSRWALLVEANRPVPPVRKQPRPDQEDAINAIAQRFEAGDTRLQLIAACGTGKTLTGLWVVERLAAHRVLVFCPSLALVHQTLKAWSEQADPATPIDALVVCSDVTVGDIHPSELPIPVTTNRETIRQFWMQESGCRVLLSTYQSIDAVRAGLQGLDPADLLIADEAHRLAGRDGKPFQGVLRDEVITAHRRLCMTATPRILTRRNAKPEDEGEDRIASMDDPAIFGEEAYRLTFGRAIQLGLLADYQIDVLVITDEEVRDYVARRILVDATQQRLDAETFAQAVAIDRAIRQDYLLRYAFTFHHRIASARTFTEALRLLHVGSETPHPFVGEVDGTMSTAKRREVLRALLNAPTGVVCSAKALSEGVDAPAVDAVVFVDPKSSVVDIVQAVGRALRRDPNNPEKRAHIVVPVVMTDPDHPEMELEHSAWADVWRVVQAMRAHDDMLAVEIDATSRELGRRRAHGESDEEFDQTLGGRLVITLPVGLPLARFRGSVFLRVVETSGDWFWSGYGALQAFVAREGHARVPQAHVEGSLKLATWVGERRTQYRQGKLLKERIAALEALPGWTWDPRADDFADGLKALKTFVAREGHARVPDTHVEGSLKLASWMSVRRGQYRQGKLQHERIAALEALPAWTWDMFADYFAKGLSALQAFVAREGHARVPQAHVEGSLKLGAWVTAQRTKYRQGKLQQEIITTLEALPGWTWDPRGDDFIVGLKAMRTFVAREGHARVPSAHLEGRLKLGQWVAERRTQYRQGKLQPDKLATLEALPGWTWDSLADDFAEGLKALQAFVAREGHARVPDAHIEGSLKLGTWVGAKRTLYRHKKIPPDKAATLEALPGWTWDPRADDFAEGLSALQAFVEREGHARVPSAQLEGRLKLGQWVSERRIQYRRGKLPPNKVAALEALPGWTWDSLADDFAVGLSALQAFVAREGHARVPRAHDEGSLKLGGWVANLRSRQGNQSPEKVALLEALPGWTWDPFADDFSDGLIVLKAFVAREGHASVPPVHEEGGLKLGSWVGARRAEYRSAKLPPDRVAALEALPGWRWDRLRNISADSLKALQAFVAREGHARVPETHVEVGLKIGRWVSKRRTKYRQGKLPSDKIAALEALPGWTWGPHVVELADVLKALKAFVAREGHARVPDEHIEGSLKIGKWAGRQRSQYRQGKLQPERIAALEALPGWTWDPRADNFTDGLQALKTFVAREGHARVPPVHEEGELKLGQWVANQRAEYHDKGLSSERIAVLEALPGWTWGPFADDFADGLKALKAFVEREGHARVPHAHVEESFKLGYWVAGRRSQYHGRKLPSEKIAALEAFPGWTWDPLADNFAEGLNALQSFVAREGHARVPDEHVEGSLKLGKWAGKRRGQYRQGKLPPGKIAALGALPGWSWDPRGDDYSDGLTALQAFVAREGHALVPHGYIEGSLKLRQWVEMRRTQYRQGRLSHEKIAILEALPGWVWNPKQDSKP